MNDIRQFCEEYFGRLSDMEESPVAKTAVLVVKMITVLFDVLTLPVYTLLQQPWRIWRNRELVYSKQSFKNRPMSSGFQRAIFRHKGCLDGVSTMEQLMRKTVARYGDRQCFGTREVFAEEHEKQADGKIFKKYLLGDYTWLTFNEVDEKIDLVGAGLYKLGVRPRQNIVVLAETRMEWMLTALATLRCNIPLVTLYATLGEDGIIHGINETEVTHMVTSQDLLPKVIKLLPRVSSLTHIIYMENRGSKETPPTVPGINVIPYSKLFELGKNSEKDFCVETPTPSSTAIIMYTSGSTGVPKGVMISHSNLLASAKGYTTIFPDTSTDECYVAYLPLAHVMELACESMIMSMGSRIGYSSPQTLTDKGTGVKTGQRGDVILLRPTMMLAVPVILDRVKKGILEGAEAKGLVSKILLNHSIRYKTFWRNAGFETPLLDRFIFKNIRSVLGGRLRLLAVGSAPLSLETFEFVKNAFNILLMRGYGLTETTSGVTVSEFRDNFNGSNTGAPLEGVHIQLRDWPEGGYTVNDYPNPRGEIVVGGDTVTKGYYKNDSLTKETYFEEDGIRWFYTGDIGELLPDGTLKIVDRKKDLVKLQFGEYVSLGKVEAELKTSPLIDNICVYGDSYYTFLIALISPNEKSIVALADQLGYEGMSVSDLCKEPKVIEAFTARLMSHGKHCNLNKMEIPLRIKLCSEEWLPETGLVTAALKIRRKQIQDFYRSDIERLYRTSM